MTKYRPRSDFKTDADYQEHYKANREAMLGSTATSVEYGHQQRAYAESRLPTDPHSIEQAKQEKLLAIYRTTLAEAQLGDRVFGVNKHRVAQYARLVAETETLIGNNSATRKFELSTEYKDLAKHRDAVSALAKDDASQNLVGLAWNSFVQSQDAATFRRETESIIASAESAESSRKFHSDMAVLQAKIKASHADSAEIQAAHDAQTAIDNARGAE